MNKEKRGKKRVNKDVRLSVRVDEKMFKELERIGTEKNLPISKMVRQALEKYIKKNRVTQR